MFQRLIRMTSAILLSFTLFVFPVMFGSGPEIDLQAKGNVQDPIDALLNAYDAALQNELLHGTTLQITDPSTGVTRILVGESQAKMDRLWAETLAKIEALQARLDAERAQKVAMLSQLSGADTMTISRARVHYNPAADLE